MKVKPSSLLCPARTEEVGLGACVPTKSVCFYPWFMWAIHSWLADSQNAKVLHGCDIEEVPYFEVGFLKSLAPRSLYMTQPLTGRGVRRTIQSFLLPSLSQKPWAGPGAREVYGQCWASSQGIFVHPEQSVPAVHVWNAEFGQAQGHRRIVTLMVVWNTDLSEQQCSDAVGSSWLEYSICSCVIYVTLAHVWSWFHLQWGKNKFLQNFLWSFPCQHHPGYCFQWCHCVWSVSSIWMCCAWGDKSVSNASLLSVAEASAVMSIAT